MLFIFSLLIVIGCQKNEKEALTGITNTSTSNLLIDAKDLLLRFNAEPDLNSATSRGVTESSFQARWGTPNYEIAVNLQTSGGENLLIIPLEKTNVTNLENLLVAWEANGITKFRIVHRDRQLTSLTFDNTPIPYMINDFFDVYDDGGPTVSALEFPPVLVLVDCPPSCSECTLCLGVAGGGGGGGGGTGTGTGTGTTNTGNTGGETSDPDCTGSEPDNPLCADEECMNLMEGFFIVDTDLIVSLDDLSPSTAFQVSKCCSNGDGEGFEECALEALFKAELSKTPGGTVIDLATKFEECFGQPDINGNYIDCSIAGNASFYINFIC